MGGNKAKKTIDWLIDSKIITGNHSEVRTEQNVIKYWKFGN